MGDWTELKRLAEACAVERCADEEERDRNLGEFCCAVEPEDVAALIAENEQCREIAEENFDAFNLMMAARDQLAERLRMFELIHGGRASELYHEISALRDEVRRLKIAAGEDVPPLPEEFVGPMPENCNARLRRKIKEQRNG